MLLKKVELNQGATNPLSGLFKGKIKDLSALFIARMVTHARFEDAFLHEIHAILMPSLNLWQIIIQKRSRFVLCSVVEFSRGLAAGSMFAFCVPRGIEVIYLLALFAPPRNVELNQLHPF